MFEKEIICPNCGTIDKPRLKTPGSILIEIILWICLLIPGLIYTIWRHSARKFVCSSCGDENPVDLKTPKGQQLKAQYHS